MTKENEKIWQAIQGLNKANDWHLTLCLSLIEALKGKGVLLDEEVQHYIKDAAKEVAKKKFELQVQMEVARKSLETQDKDKYM
jgi:hypothetical protein